MSFNASFHGQCADGCDEPIRPGDLIERVVGGFPDEHLGYRHITCPDPVDEAPSAGHRDLCHRCFTYQRGECI